MPPDQIVLTFLITYFIGAGISAGVVGEDNLILAFFWPFFVFVVLPVLFLYGIGRGIRRLLRGSWD